MKSKFQVLIPHNAARGGPESLYQLAFLLKQHNQDVEIVYTLDWRKFFSTRKIKVPNEMKKYSKDIQIRERINDSKGNIVIIPETFTAYSRKIKSAQVFIYWLSVNNYFFNYEKYKGKKYSILKFLHPHFDSPLTFNQILNSNFCHIAQSEYAENFIQTNFGKKPFLIYDFIDKIPNFDEGFFNLIKRKKIILYNPMKGYSTTKKLIKALGNEYKFVPLINLSYPKLIELLKYSAIYIDFGEHPGRDRIPREAILCGCCVITGYKGSASFKDVPLSRKFKIFEDENLEKNFRAILKELFNKAECRDLYQNAYKILLKDKFIAMNQVNNFLKKDYKYEI